MEEIFLQSNKILATIVGTLCLLLGLWVRSSNKNMKVNIFFFWMSLFLFLWIVFCYVGNSVFITESPIWGRIAYGTVALFFIPFYFFSMSFLNEYGKRKKTDIFLITSSISLFVLSVFTPFMVKSMDISKYGAIPVLADGKYIYFVLILFWFVFIGYRFFANYSKSKKYEKNKLFYFLIGFFTWVLANLIFNVILPFFQGIPQYWAIGNYSALFLLGCTAYAIVKHRLMDIRLVVARSVAFMIMMVSIVGFAAGFMMYLPNVLFGADANNQYSLFLRAGFGLIMVFGFQPFRRFITKITDKIFFKNDYELHELIKKITNNIYSTLILIELLYKTIDILIREMKASRGMFVLLDEDGKIHTTQSIGYGQTPEVSAKEVTAFAKHGILLFDDLTEGSHFKTIFRRVNASIAVGFINEGKPVGALFLGEKNSGDMYNTKDIKLFEVLAPEMVVAIQRAEEHEKVQNFNVYLQSEVARKTKELQEANEHLLELDKAKDEFISMASHQLRTPLTAIKGYLSMLLEGDAGEVKMSQYDFINEAFSAGNRMVALINDLLNVSRMDTGRFFLEPVTVDIEKVVQEEMKQLSNSARDKKLYLKLENKAKALPKITVDETKIRQVVMNFIDNAIYYTMKGGVTVILDKDDKNVIFRVEDTGIGVPEKAKEELFTKFFRAENARTARPDGTGLGIYLARKVIEDHGGGVIFESTEGKGSVFGFKLPIKSKIKKEITVPPPDLAAAAK